MTEATPTVGRIVHYTLNAADADAINRRRQDFRAYTFTHPRGVAGDPGATGHVGHTGNDAYAGQTFPAIIVRTFGGPVANLQVLLDGTDTYWATSRGEGTGEGQWQWPPRV